ncbi:MAG TPA: hypothetical protein VGO11_06565 [Chthoniobacteraceae bacterium]|jgi:hypothetical protein|nr:hypothetical protein [Chthoniobacteraceae bacterium]
MKTLALLFLFSLKLALSAALLAPEPWSVVGKWKVKNGSWEALLELKSDGTVTRSDDKYGHWSLTSSEGHLVLVLDWAQWQAETATMFQPDYFRGRSQAGEFELRRERAPEAQGGNPGTENSINLKEKGAGWSTEIKAWAQGEPAVRLIRKEEGFCALTKVTGAFEGGGEAVQVYVGDDGWWYLGGISQQDGVAAECVVVRFPHK